MPQSPAYDVQPLSSKETTPAFLASRTKAGNLAGALGLIRALGQGDIVVEPALLGALVVVRIALAFLGEIAVVADEDGGRPRREGSRGSSWGVRNWIRDCVVEEPEGKQDGCGDMLAKRRWHGCCLGV